ncbi:unnamed protein product [Cuscuta epithymum]|uniref:Bromo domain-containing protein n=1 Tax=Cuscuta epithymum TaxID=186058 RepID=A0AAV0C1D4_9ASTE|nr:unnamed protein product [Cuscuta epithymum]
MGQIVRRGKKGRPSKSDLAARNNAAVGEAEGELRRSGRRRNVRYTFDFDDFLDDDYFDDDDEDDSRKEKKLEQLLQLQGEDNDGEDDVSPRRTRNLSHAPAASASDGDADGKPSKKRKIFGYDEEYEVNDDDDDEDDEENENDYEVRDRKAECRSVESSPGTPSRRTSGISLPDKKMLELILDKLQKKDIYGVYAEPVDPEELPDYHDVIEHPMDFSTVRNKLGNGSYATLEQFESDVFLICSNAMQYNASDTIYYKQASSIQELATKKFQELRVNAERAVRSEKEVKSDQMLKPNPIVKKLVKKHMVQTAQEPIGSDFSSGATLAHAGDVQNGSSACLGNSGRISIIDGPIEGGVSLTDILDKEELHSGKGHLGRFGRKSVLQDENRRATYDISTQYTSSSESVFCTFDAESKHLVPVGLYADHSYARSLACFAATLGPIAWEYASRRIEQALPPGSKFGRGWVGEYEPLPTPVLMMNHTLKEPSFLAKLTQKVEVEEDNIEGLKEKDEVNQQDYVGSKPTTPNNIESKPSFLASSEKKPPNSASPLYHPQCFQSQSFVESNKLMRQFELNSQPLPCKQTSVEQIKVAPKNRNLMSPSAPSQLPNRKGKDNSSQSNETVCPASGGERGLSDAVQLPSMLSKKSKTKGNSLQQSPGADSNNAASAAAARAWMSIGASGGFKQVNDGQISAESLYNPSRDFQPHNLQFCPSSGGMHSQPVKGGYPFHAFMSHTTRGAGIDGQVPNRPQVMFPQFVAPADLSRFHVASRQNLNAPPTALSRSRQVSVPPPDLNISFQSSGSPPGRASSGILLDSQQPDLALQL